MGVVVVVGMGQNVRDKSLLSIAGSQKNVFKAKGFKKLADPTFIDDIRSRVCTVAEENMPTKPPPKTVPLANFMGNTSELTILKNTCLVRGKTHYVTFDGLNYNLLAGCN